MLVIFLSCFSLALFFCKGTKKNWKKQVFARFSYVRARERGGFARLTWGIRQPRTAGFEGWGMGMGELDQPVTRLAQWLAVAFVGIMAKKKEAATHPGLQPPTKNYYGNNLVLCLFIVCFLGQKTI